MYPCLALPAAAHVWPPAPLHLISRQLMPMPFVAEKSCSSPRAYKAEVHRQRGILVESRHCWQVVPLPSQAVPRTIPHESESESESESKFLCQLFLSRTSLLLRRSHSPRIAVFFSDYLRQTMPQSTNSTSGTISACWHTTPSSGPDLACDKDFYSFYLSTRQKWPPLAQPISNTFPDLNLKAEMQQYGYFQILVANIMCSFPSR